MDKLVCTTNSLQDIIGWLKKGYMICIYSKRKSIFYYSREIIQTITDEKIVYIDVQSNPGLLDDDEWPFYIEEEGFRRYDRRYESRKNIPTKTDNIFHFTI